MTNLETVCWHCGEPLQPSAPLYAIIQGYDRAMCCHGCRAAAEWIEQLGLGDYYRLRTSPATKPDIDVSAGGEQAWRRPDVARHVVRELGESRCESMLLIEGIRCSACVWLIERSLGALRGVVSVQVNAAARRARIVWRATEVSLPQILERLSRAGYRALPLDAKALDDARRRESRDALKRLAVAGFGAMQAMMFATVLYLGGAESTATGTTELFRWLGFMVAIPVVFYSARPFFTGALRCLKARRLGMDVPVALGIAIIFTASLIQGLRGGGDVYFDSVSMFVFFLLAGRYFEMRARHRAGHLTDALARLTPPFADRRRPDGSLERVGIQELRSSDCVHIAEGGIVPADGVLLSERCYVDEAILTGESGLVVKHRHDSLMAGSVLVGIAEMCVRRTGTDTVLAGIATLVERAHSQRPQLAQAGDRVTSHFVARVLALTALTIVVWSFLDPSRAFGAALAVLVVSCPCAFALAVPTAITRALSVLAQRGVLVVNPDAIQALAEATHIVFDKTGTLTEPLLAMADVETFNGFTREQALRLAASLARESRHPAARAITNAWSNQEFDIATRVNSQAGLGISGIVAGRELRLGRLEFAMPAGQLIDSNFTDTVLADNNGAIAAFRFDERLRSGAAAAVGVLKRQGLSVHIASGDAPGKVAEIAARLEVTDWRARQLPEDKLLWLTKLRAEGGRVIAVGDGVNDAPVLAGADVAIALGGGADLAQTSSDIVLKSGRLDALAPARALAQETLSILRQNQRWALFYNVTAVPLAALGFVPPWLAALGMSLSSLCVILNAMRIGRGKQTATVALKPADHDPIEPHIGVA